MGERIREEESREDVQENILGSWIKNKWVLWGHQSWKNWWRDNAWSTNSQ